jgi:hypothetical protein
VIENTKAIKADPNNYLPYCKRGKAKKRRWDYSGAITDMTKALKLNPAYREAFLARGGVRSGIMSLKNMYLDSSFF